MQSLMATLLLAVSEPILGVMADRSGLSAAYIALAAGLCILVLFLFWTSRQHLLLPEIVKSDQSEVKA
jgi:MFS-type transporter involved in bile tolerance (Atg22 family)